MGYSMAAATAPVTNALNALRSRPMNNVLAHP
jgi:hypothetical protein